MVWQYNHVEEIQEKLLLECLSKSKLKAEKVASSLGVDLLGVHEFIEQDHDSPSGYLPTPVVAASSRGTFAGKTVSKDELELSISHSKRIFLKLIVKYRVGSLKTAMEKE